MGAAKKKYYVEGNIVVNTPFFKCENSRGGCGLKPEGCEILPTNNNPKYGSGVLLIDDDYPQTMFAEYYAKGQFSVGYLGAETYYETYEEIYGAYKERIDEALSICSIQADSATSAILRRQAFIMVVAAIDTYVADTILVRILNSKELFDVYATNVIDRNTQSKLLSLLVEENRGKYEQEVIEYLLSRSYADINNINKVYANKTLFGIETGTVLSNLAPFFKERHRIAHRNGRNKAGAFPEVCIDRINELVKCSNDFVGHIQGQLVNKL